MIELYDLAYTGIRHHMAHFNSENFYISLAHCSMAVYGRVVEAFSYGAA